MVDIVITERERDGLEEVFSVLNLSYDSELSYIKKFFIRAKFFFLNML